MARTGRPPKPINWDQVAKLAHIQCLEIEIANFIGVDIKSLRNRCKKDLGLSFSLFYEQNKEGGRISLRRSLWQKALHDKNTVATIFACKQYLGMKDFDSPAKVAVQTQDVNVTISWPDDTDG